MGELYTKASRTSKYTHTHTHTLHTHTHTHMYTHTHTHSNSRLREREESCVLLRRTHSPTHIMARITMMIPNTAATPTST